MTLRNCIITARQTVTFISHGHSVGEASFKGAVHKSVRSRSSTSISLNEPRNILLDLSNLLLVTTTERQHFSRRRVKRKIHSNPRQFHTLHYDPARFDRFQHFYKQHILLSLCTAASVKWTLKVVSLMTALSALMKQTFFKFPLRAEGC